MQRDVLFTLFTSRGGGVNAAFKAHTRSRAPAGNPNRTLLQWITSKLPSAIPNLRHNVSHFLVQLTAATVKTFKDPTRRVSAHTNKVQAVWARKECSSRVCFSHFCDGNTSGTLWENRLRLPLGVKDKLVRPAGGQFIDVWTDLRDVSICGELLCSFTASQHQHPSFNSRRGTLFVQVATNTRLQVIFVATCDQTLR